MKELIKAEIKRKNKEKLEEEKLLKELEEIKECECEILCCNNDCRNRSLCGWSKNGSVIPK